MIAVISDIHSNMEALMAVLDDIASRNVERIVCLGDVVGYGPQPGECLDMVKDKAEFTLLGNHDYAVLYEPSKFNIGAETACYATRQQLEDEPGESIGWKQTGSMRVASSQDRMQEIRAATTLGRSYGLDMHLLSSQEACDLFPLMDPDGVVGANYLPTDGYVDPTMLTNALAKGARNLGARIHRNTCVMDMIVKNSVVTEVVTDKGNIKAEIVVNAAGIWAR